MLAANGFGGLEAGAREAVRNLMEQTGIEDVESLQNALRTGALKVRLSDSFVLPPLFTSPPTVFSLCTKKLTFPCSPVERLVGSVRLIVARVMTGSTIEWDKRRRSVGEAKTRSGGFGFYMLGWIWS